MSTSAILDVPLREPQAGVWYRGLGTLIKLPPEIREVVYHYVLTEGKNAWTKHFHREFSKSTLDILCTSKAINKEATPHFYKERVFYYEEHYRFRGFYFSHRFGCYLQNLRVRLLLDSDDWCLGHDLRFRLELLHGLTESQVLRKDCVIEYKATCPSAYEIHPDIIAVLAGLTGFKRVDFDLDRLQWCERRLQEHTTMSSTEDSHLNRVLVWLTPAVEQLKDSLGPAEIRWGMEFWRSKILRQIFYPRKHALTVKM